MAFGHRAFFFATISFFFAQGGFSEAARFFSPRADWTFSNGMTIKTSAEGADSFARMDFSALCDMNEIFIKSGFKTNPYSVDFTTQAVYWPTLFGRLNVGLGGIFHACSWRDEFFERDFLFGMYWRYAGKRPLVISGSCSFLYKDAKIFAIADFVPSVANKSMAFELNFDFPVLQKFHFWLSAASYSFYDYFLFLAPVFRLGAERSFLERLSAGAEVEARYIDMFTLSANFSELNARAFVSVRLNP